MPAGILIALAVWSRLRYGVFSYHHTYGSGDANLVLARAQFIMRGEWRPPVEVGAPASIFADPPLIPFVLAAFSRITTVPLEDAPLIATPLLTIAALVLYELTPKSP